MSTTKMKGTYPTFDGELTVTFLNVEDDPGKFTQFKNIELFEDGEEIGCYYLIKKYGCEDAERFILGAIRNANAV
jgi:hypothetical protein